MRSCHNLSAGVYDPNLVSCAGLIPVMTLAERAGLHDLTATHVRVPGSAGSNPDVKVGALVAGMVAGADTIDAMDLLRHGGMGRVLTAGRAQLIAMPARIARSARRLRLHLPRRWPWEHAWQAMFTAAGGPPIPAT